MKLAWFGVEEWLNPMDSLARINLGSSCVSALRMDELFDLTGEDLDAFLNEMRTMSLHYHHGDATGSPRIKAAVAGIYPKGNVKPEEVMITHGGTGANDLVLMSVLEPGDNCVVIKPSYQQHYDIPKGSGIETRVVQLKAEDNYQLDFDALDKACDANTKMIVLTNPNNPIGVTLYDEGLRKIVDIAAKHDAWILCDEVYRGLDENYMPSILDYGYHKAISISSMSKMYSMAGTRIGWIVCRDHEMYEVMKTRRSYNTICCGIWDEIIASIALEHYQALELQFDCIYTGYLGGEAQVALAEKAFALWPAAYKVVDPVMGDNGKAYSTVTPALVERIRSLCRAADLILPNYTEAQLLLQQQPVTDELDDTAAQALADALQPLASNAVVTG